MHTEEQREMQTRRPPAKMDIFNPYTQIGGKSKSCQAETVLQKRNFISEKARENNMGTSEQTHC